MGLIEFLEKAKKEEMDLVKVEEGQLILAKQMQDKLIELEKQKNGIEELEKEIKKQLEEVMRAHNITGYESNDKLLKISLGEDSVVETIDKDKLFREHIEAYRNCVKESIRKGALRITVRSKK